MNHAGIRKSEGRGLVAQSADVELPPMVVYCPIQPAIHPSAAAVEAASAVWLAHYQYFGDDAFRRALLATKSAEFAARVSPHAITEWLQIASDWDYWGFASTTTVTEACSPPMSQPLRPTPTDSFVC
jgi:hypothetical protein